MNFDQYKFRCSELGYLLTDPRSKSEPLSETSKTYLKEIYIKVVYGREKLITNKYMQKGVACESDTLELVAQTTGQKYFKNLKQLENEYITGTPDAWYEDHVLDVKTSWDIWTFGSVDENKAKKDYYGQLLGYMFLTDKKKAKLAYGLVNTPQEQIDYEMYLLKVKGLVKDGDEQEEEKALKNFMYDDIPAKDKIKIYDFELDESVLEKLIERIKVARFYLNSLSL